MKKLGFVIFMACGLASCASDNGLGVTQGVAANYLNKACLGYIEKQSTWNVAKVALGSKADQVKEELCNCASEEAARNMSTSDMIALANPEKRQAVLLDLIAPTVTSCYGKMSGLF